MQVACPSCSSEYPVNERRLPATGLKMRCPKCGSRFHVHPDGRTDAADAAPSPLAPAKSFQKPADPIGDLELDLPAPKLAEPKAAARAPLGSPARKPAPTQDDLDLDLPAPKGALGPAPVDDFELDLPAPKAPTARPPGAKRPLAPPVDLAPVDLARKEVAPKPVAKKPIAPPVDLASRDLGPKPAMPRPMAPTVKDLPASRAKPAAAMDDLDLDLPMAKPAPKRPTPAGAGGPPRGGASRPIAPPMEDLDLDLPMPAASKPKAPPIEDLDLDLPIAKPAKKPAPRMPDLDLELPTPPAKRPIAPPVADLDLDLPAVRPKRPPAPKGADLDLDLPMPKARLAPQVAEIDLPSPKAALREPAPALADRGRNPFDDLDLPAPKSVLAEADEAFGDLDLPMPKAATGGGGFGDLDLPVPKGASDRPVARPFGDIDLPAPRGMSDLPALKGDGFDGLDLLEPKGASDLPTPKAYGDLDLPEPRGISDFPALKGEEADLPVSRGDHDLPVAKGHAGFGELDLPEPRASRPSGASTSMRDPAGRSGVGGTGFGELDLGAGGGDDMEFADIPQQERASLPPQVTPPPRVAVDKRRDKAEKKAAAGEPKKGRAAIVVGVLLVLVLGAGAGLGFTPYGYFGMYYFDRYMPGAGDPAQVRAAIARAEEQAESDSWAGARQSLSTLASARRGAGLNRELLARSLVHESLFQIRFGADASSATRASAIRRRLEERGGLEGPELALGLAADALRADNASGARGRLSAARRHAPSDPYVDLLAGEVALARGEAAEAREAFARAAERGAGVRGLWGVARALRGGDDATAERAAIDAVLRASPTHEDALLARAARLMDEGDLDGALAIAERVVGRTPVEGQRLRVAPRARALGWTLIGRGAEARGRGTQALEAYGRALTAHDAHVPALLGAGRVLLTDRPADAIARFDSVLAAAGATDTILANGRTAAQEAQLGSARANLALDHVQEAATLLGQLSAARADDAEVLLWLGHAERRLDPPNREAAEAHYRAAIATAPDEFAGYLALAELFFETDRGTDAGTVLEQASERVPDSAEMRLELGRFELRRNRLPAAITELGRALALDADLPAAHFALGVAYRRAGRLEEADRTFAHLARIDPSHPRLALERGLLFEARGDSVRAVESYRAALAENEGDMDLMLRLGAAQVAAGAIDDAERTLGQVYEARPNSPDAIHLVGRVAFARGRFAEALNQFRQASRIDPTRGELHLYVAWAALESNQLGEALQSAEAAISRDPSLGEAYWVRAVVRLRSGNPADALPDLVRALELRPAFHRVHATMGDTYDQLGRLSEAVAAYERAVALVDDEGGWWWRLGRLRMDGNDRRGALVALSRATLLGEAATPLPGWLAASHRLYGDALRLDNQRGEAVTHYRRYLALAPPGDIDRADVRRILMDMGEVPGD